MSDNSTFRNDEALSRLPYLSTTSRTWQPDSGLHFDTTSAHDRRHFSTQHRTLHPNPLFSKVKRKNAASSTPQSPVAELPQNRALGSEMDKMMERLEELDVVVTTLQRDLEQCRAALAEKDSTVAKLSEFLKKTESELQGYKTDAQSIVSKNIELQMRPKLKQLDQRRQGMDAREREMKEEATRLKQKSDAREREIEGEAERLKEREEKLTAQTTKRDRTHAAQIAELKHNIAANEQAKRLLEDERNEDHVWQRKERAMADRYNNKLEDDKRTLILTYFDRLQKYREQQSRDIEEAKRGYKLRQGGNAEYKEFANNDKSVLHSARGFFESSLPAILEELHRLAEKTVDTGSAGAQVRQAIQTVKNLRDVTRSFWEIDDQMLHNCRKTIATQHSSSLQYDFEHLERASHISDRVEIVNAAQVRHMISAMMSESGETGRHEVQPDWRFALETTGLKANFVRLRALREVLNEPLEYQLLREVRGKEWSTLSAHATKTRQGSLIGAVQDALKCNRALRPLRAKRVVLLKQLGRTADLEPVALKARDDIKESISQLLIEIKRRQNALARTKTMRETGQALVESARKKANSSSSSSLPRSRSRRLVGKTASKPTRSSIATTKQDTVPQSKPPSTTTTKPKQSNKERPKKQRAAARAERDARDKMATASILSTSSALSASDTASPVKLKPSAQTVDPIKRGRRRLARSPLALLSSEMPATTLSVRPYTTMPSSLSAQHAVNTGQALEDATWETCSELSMDDYVGSPQSQVSSTAESSPYALSVSGSDKTPSAIESSDEADDDTLPALQYHIPNDAYTVSTGDGSTATPANFSFRLYKHEDGRMVKLYYHDTLKKAEAAAATLLDEPVLGFDLEWEEYSKPGTHDAKRCVSMLQLANESGCHLFHFALFKGSETEDLISPSLRKLLSSPNSIKTGVNVAGDAGRLKTCFGIDSQGMFELSHLYKLVNFGADEPEKVDKRLVRLAGQVEDILHLSLDKGAVRTSAWSAKLDMQQLEYAASDAYAGFRLFHALDEKRRALEPRPPRPAFWELGLPIMLADGSLAQSRSRKKIVATATEEEDIFYDALENQDDIEDIIDVKGVQAAKSKPERQISEEIDRANDWIADWLPTQKSGLTPAPLRAYHLWQKQGFTIEETAAKLRQPPILASTVAGYIADAVSRGHLTYSPERLKVALQSLPPSVHGRYRGLLAKLKSQLEQRTVGHYRDDL